MAPIGRIYVSGPMTGLPLYNWPAFEVAARVLRSQGWDVVSPTETDEKVDHVVVTRSGGSVLAVETTGKYTYEQILALDFEDVRSCTHIFLLPGWQHSTGARRELAVAIECGLEIILNAEVFTDARV